MRVRWDRLRIFVILALVLAGLVSVVVAAWRWNTTAGVAVMGGAFLFSAFFLAYLTDTPEEVNDVATRSAV